MKILHIIASMDPKSGGPCQGIRNIMPQLNNLGISSEVVCIDSPRSDFHSLDPFTIHAIGTGYSKWNYNKNLTPWLIENISRFDILIVHGLWLYHGYAVYQSLKKTKVDKNSVQPKFYIMPHGMLDPYFQKAESRKFKAIRNWFYWKFIEHKIIDYADGVLFTCQEELTLAKESFHPYHPKNELNVGFGIEEPPIFKMNFRNEFYKVCPELKNQPYILFLSRIHEKKGVDILIEAYNLVLTKAVSSARTLPKLLIAGPGIDSPYGSQLVDRVKNLSLQDHIIFSDMLMGSAKWGAFYECKVFILPSHQENFGIAVVEALACKKMVLISNKVNIWREIENDKAGLIFDNTISDTKKALEKWISLSDSEKSQLSNNARQLFLNKYHVTNSTKNLISQLV